MESKTNIPSFTVSLRGYDRVEVDEYLDSLAEALGQVDDAQEQNRRLQTQVARLNSRIKELEDHINADTPKTGAILAERIGILLRTAEETASDTVLRAEAEAARLGEEAKQRLADAEESARVSIARGEEQARRIEASARAQAAEIASEAEARATARTRQIEQWAEQVISHTRAEEARMLREQQEKRNAALAELRSLAEQRDAVAGTLAQLRETLGQALGLVAPTERTAALTGKSSGPAALPAAPGVPAGTLLSDAAGEAGEDSEPPAGSDRSIPAAAAGASTAVEEPVTEGTAPTTGPDDEEGASTADAGAPGAVPAQAADPAGDTGPVAAVQSDDGGASEQDDSDRADTPTAAYDVVDDASADDEDPADEHPWWEPRNVRPPFDGEALETEGEQPATGEIELRDTDNGAEADQDQIDEFEAKLEAWVSEGAKHFRRR